MLQNKPAVIRNGVKIILLNKDHELLLMCTDDSNIQSNTGSYNGIFWQMIGGKIENGETIIEAAYRELYEETGLTQQEVNLENRACWYGEFDLFMYGVLTRIKQSFLVAKTRKIDVSLANLTDEEKLVVKRVKWFTLTDITNCNEIIYPAVLKDYLPDVINGLRTDKPIILDLAK